MADTLLKRQIALCAVLAMSFLLPVPSSAQSPDGQNGEATPNAQQTPHDDKTKDKNCTDNNRRSLFTPARKIDCGTVTIDMTAQYVHVPHAVPVANGSQMRLKITHVITDKCSINFTAAALTTTNPLGSILGILAGKPSVPSGQTKNLTEEVAFLNCLDNLDPSLAPSDADAKALEQRLQNLKDTIEQESDTLEPEQNSPVLDAIKNFSTCTPKSVCSEDNFDKTKQTIQTELDSLIKQVGTLKSANHIDDIHSLSQEVKTRGARGTVSEGKWLDNVKKFLSCAKQKGEGNANIAQRLDTTLASLRGELLKLNRIVDDVYVLPLYRNEKGTGNVVCSDATSKSTPDSAGAPLDDPPPSDPSAKGATKPPVPVEIDYQNPPLVSGSAGIVASLLGQHTVGIKTKNAVNGSNAFTTYFAVTNQSPAQFIPFGLAHLFLYGTKTNFLSLSGGVGINPYNSTTQIEYFVGPSFSTHGVFLSVGTHVGRYQDLGGGFTIGNPVPAGWSSNTSVPTTLRYTARLAFGISYKLP